MRARTIPAVFMRGGTSKGLLFKASDLPSDHARWDSLFCAMMGSPDSNGRQLNGMGGGLSSLSKVCVIGRPSRADADVDYTFAQVAIREARVDMSGNCGNMSSAIGPFAVDEGLIAAADGPVTLRIHNTNTRKIIHSTFEVRDGRAVQHGDLAIPGVAGTGAPIRLEFMEPGGAITGKLLPTGEVIQELDVPGVGRIDVSMVDAGNACVFIRAESLGLSGNETPEQIERDARLMEALQAIRAHGSVAMKIAPDLAAARAKQTTPSIGIISAPTEWRSIDGETFAADAADLAVRMISSNQPHRALPLTASLCVAVAASLPESLVHTVARYSGQGPMRLGMPSGVLTVSAEVRKDREGWYAQCGSFYRTARRLFEGRVCLPE
ncbi:MAG TPA: PrpF domain-containing protein [Burkholderiaceae bacterium]|nr:PrpF domain-containing protein [Burkholderiaceae bacterium]